MARSGLPCPYRPGKKLRHRLQRAQRPGRRHDLRKTSFSVRRKTLKRKHRRITRRRRNTDGSFVVADTLKLLRYMTIVVDFVGIYFSYREYKK